MGRMVPVVLQMEDDVDPGQKEYKKSFTPRERNLRRFKLWGWTCRFEYEGETTSGTSVCIHLMKNFTEAREAIPGFGRAPIGVINESHWGGYIGHSCLLNTGTGTIAFNTTCMLPKPVEFERDDVLGYHIVCVNKGSSTVRFETLVVLYLEVED